MMYVVKQSGRTRMRTHYRVLAYGYCELLNVWNNFRPLAYVLVVSGGNK